MLTAERGNPSSQLWLTHCRKVVRTLLPTFQSIRTNIAACSERREWLISKRHKVSTLRQSSKKEGDRQARSVHKNLSHFPSRFCFLSPHPSCRHSPPMVREGLLAVTVPQESCSGTVNTVKEGSPATLSSPNSCLGREGPLPCGSSMSLARAPSPRERALPLHLTNPAQ